MINEIKIIIENYLNNRKLTKFILGTCTANGIQINEKLIIPNVLIKGNLKEKMTPGDKVRLLRNDGGQEFLILELVGKNPWEKNEEVE